MQNAQSAPEDAKILETATAPTIAEKQIDHTSTTPPADSTLSDAAVDTLQSAISATFSKATRRLRHPNLDFRHDGMPMLSQKGFYPQRFDYPLRYWDWVCRSERAASDWFADWENSLRRAGWTAIRTLTDEETNELPYKKMDPAMPEDADLYCPRRSIYLALAPSWIPEPSEDHWHAIRGGYPGSLFVVHARNPERHSIAIEGDRRALRLLSQKNTARCFKLNALVEFQGVLYSADGPDLESWSPTADQTALEVYHEYRLNSIRYHEEQELMDLQAAHDYQLTGVVTNND